MRGAMRNAEAWHTNAFVEQGRLRIVMGSAVNGPALLVDSLLHFPADLDDRLDTDFASLPGPDFDLLLQDD
jgi:hypothetical protein